MQGQDKRLSKEQFFMGVAELARLKSYDRNLKVGCCIVEGGRIVGLGYNGFVRGIENKLETWEKKKKCEYLQHAEVNAINHSCFKDSGRVTLYVTCYPCEKCIREISQRKFNNKYYKKYPEGLRVDVLNMDGNGDQFLVLEESQKLCEAKRDINKLQHVENSEYPPRLIKSWDQLYMSIAYLAQQRCDINVQSKQGSCIVKDNRLLGFGYTSIPSQVYKPKEGEDSNGIDYEKYEKYELGAIQNAFCNIQEDIQGSVIYVTSTPSREAILQSIQKKISKIVYRGNEKKEDQFTKYDIIMQGWDESIDLFYTIGKEKIGDNDITVSYGERKEEQKILSYENAQNLDKNSNKEGKKESDGSEIQKKQKLSDS